MVQLWIDNVEVDVSEGTTVLAATRKLGIDIPALCKHEDYPANNSCMCCLVRTDSSASTVPACSTVVSEGMHVESETQEIRDLRRTGLELLLGDHAGDCRAPCENTCPARMDIPNMLRHLAEGDYRAAIETVKQDIALPAILGRVCPEVCENGCRRGQHDSPAAICKLKQFAADQDLASETPYCPPIKSPTGKRVAIVGGGPTGLTAAYHLAQNGHDCTLFDKNQTFGGRLREEFSAEDLPRDVLDAEIGVVLGIGCDTQFGSHLGKDIFVDELTREFQAVLITTGRSESAWIADLGVKTTNNGVQVDTHTRMTSRDKVFAAGNVVRPYKLVVQSVAEGKLAADCIDSWLRGTPPPDRRRAFESRLARLSSGELCDFCDGFPETPRVEKQSLDEGLTEVLARQEAERCLHCDCGSLGTCQLHHYAESYQCDAHRFRGHGRRYEGRLVGNGVALEIGKCIVCGICVQITMAASDAVGLSVLDRSMEMRIGPPPNIPLDEAFGSVARQCAEACPTGAIILTD